MLVLLGPPFEGRNDQYAQLAELSGRLRHELSGPQRPNTGDWLMLEVQGERATI